MTYVRLAVSSKLFLLKSLVLLSPSSCCLSVASLSVGSGRTCWSTLRLWPPLSLGRLSLRSHFGLTDWFACTLLLVRSRIVFLNLDLIIFFVVFPSIFAILIFFLLLGLFVFLFHLGDVHVPLGWTIIKFIPLMLNVNLDDVGLNILELARVRCLLPGASS